MIDTISGLPLTMDECTGELFFHDGLLCDADSRKTVGQMEGLFRSIEGVDPAMPVYRTAQAKATVRVNAEQLLFNWELGRDLVARKAEERWGSGVVEQVSPDLQNEFPDSRGFSTTNLWYMKRRYLFYSTGDGCENENPTIGLLICKGRDRTGMQWALRGIGTPISVATYGNIRIDDVRGLLLSEGQIRQRVDQAEYEFRASIERGE